MHIRLNIFSEITMLLSTNIPKEIIIPIIEMILNVIPIPGRKMNVSNNANGKEIDVRSAVFASINKNSITKTIINPNIALFITTFNLIFVLSASSFRINDLISDGIDDFNPSNLIFTLSTVFIASELAFLTTLNISPGLPLATAKNLGEEYESFTSPKSKILMCDKNSFVFMGSCSNSSVLENSPSILISLEFSLSKEPAGKLILLP